MLLVFPPITLASILNKRCQANWNILCTLTSFQEDGKLLVVITNLNVTQVTGLSAEALITEILIKERSDLSSL